MRSREPEEGTITSSARRKRRGQKILLKVVFQLRPSRGASVVVSVPKRKAVFESFAAMQEIQNVALR